MKNNYNLLIKNTKASTITKLSFTDVSQKFNLKLISAQFLLRIYIYIYIYDFPQLTLSL